MPNPFDELMRYWNKTADEYIAWMETKDTQSIEDLLKHTIKLFSQADEFEKYANDLKATSPAGESTLIAAKFKNQYTIHRFLSMVLMELSMRLFSLLQQKSNKDKIDPKIKSMIVEEVKIQILKELRKKSSSQTKKIKRKNLVK